SAPTLRGHTHLKTAVYQLESNLATPVCLNVAASPEKRWVEEDREIAQLDARLPVFGVMMSEENMSVAY
ncbi:MAG: hypothetical protein ACREEM_26695, partial [Blastocatellia bacterium]